MAGQTLRDAYHAAYGRRLSAQDDSCEEYAPPRTCLVSPRPDDGIRMYHGQVQHLVCSTTERHCPVLVGAHLRIPIVHYLLIHAGEDGLGNLEELKWARYDRIR